MKALLVLVDRAGPLDEPVSDHELKKLDDAWREFIEKYFADAYGVIPEDELSNRAALIQVDAFAATLVGVELAGIPRDRRGVIRVDFEKRFVPYRATSLLSRMSPTFGLALGTGAFPAGQTVSAQGRFGATAFLGDLSLQPFVSGDWSHDLDNSTNDIGIGLGLAFNWRDPNMAVSTGLRIVGGRWVVGRTGWNVSVAINLHRYLLFVRRIAGFPYREGYDW